MKLSKYFDIIQCLRDETGRLHRVEGNSWDMQGASFEWATGKKCHFLLLGSPMRLAIELSPLGDHFVGNVFVQISDSSTLPAWQHGCTEGNWLLTSG